MDANCSDGVFCNGAEVCSNGACAAGAPPSCNDSATCTTDSCDAATDKCVHGASNAACDDALFCDGTEKCDPPNGAAVTGCTAGSGSPCDDGVACTTDACSEATKSCTNTPNDASCSDAKACNGVETCGLMGCLPGVALDCNDAISCTADFCDLQTDACAHVKQDSKCDDGVFCDGSEKCDPASGAPLTGCAAGAPVDCNDAIACTADACNEAQKACTHTPDAVPCSDGVFCNGVEVCSAALGCQAGAPVNCDDGVSCTGDACSEALKTCTHAPNNASCSDGLNCNGQEACDPSTGCKAGTPIPCPSDGIACTVDACVEATSTCQHTVDNSLCPMGQFCIVAQNGCTAGKPCMNNAICDDGNACNGVEACVAGICNPGTPVNCDDGVACTTDTCNPVSGACSHAANNAFCDDGLACNGVETCVVGQGCAAGQLVNCDDGIVCTADACNEPGGTCVHPPIDALCSDGKLCDGIEVCDPATGCKPGPAYVCPPDGVACTTEVCDPVANLCKSIADDSSCPCTQSCDAQKGCGNYCVVATCQGKTYQCGDCLDNDGDCRIDSGDSQCLGPCDNTEDSYYGGIPGQNNSPCKSDCYFDADTGSGNDDCFWSHKCDPHEVPPNYSPEDSSCAYNLNANIPGTGETCAQLYTAQSAQCHGYCGPLTPNGCDCFGCCSIPGAPTTVWLGSENPPGTGSCNIATVADPTKCKPCEQVAACLNPCDVCELCVGKTVLPPQCVVQTCPVGKAACGLLGQPACAVGSSCITGCCELNPQ